MSTSNGHTDDAEAPVTPRVSRSSGRAMHVLATPIISVAVTPRTSRPAEAAPRPLSNPPYEVVKPTKSAPNASAWPLGLVEEPKQQPPAGVVEGVTLVEPRAVPGNGSDLDSIILAPGVQSEALAHREGERRRAPTIRTRIPFRREALAPASAPRKPSRRSSTLLAAVIAIALILVGVSALLHTEKDSERVSEVSEPAAPRQRLEVQAALPQASAMAAPASLVIPEPPAVTATEHPAPSEAESPSLPATQSTRARASVAVPSRTTAPSRSARAATVTQRSSVHVERSLDVPVQAGAPTSDSKSWIKVRD